MITKTLPKWAEPYWEPAECTIEKTTDNRFAIVCHATQQQVAIADSREECCDFLGMLRLSWTGDPVLFL